MIFQLHYNENGQQLFEKEYNQTVCYEMQESKEFNWLMIESNDQNSYAMVVVTKS